MADDKKITELTELTTMEAGDVIPVSEASSSTTKKVTYTNLFKAPSCSSVTLPNAGWVGIGVALERLNFYTAGYAAFQGCNLGVGTATPRKLVDLLSTSQAQLRLTYTNNSVYADFTVDSSGHLTVAPTGDFIFNPTGNDILPTTNYDLNLGSLTKKYLTLHAAELWTGTLVAADTIATIGGRVLVGPTTVLTSDLGDGAGDTTIYAEHNEIANGDVVYLEANGKVEFMTVTTGAGGSGPYSYTVTRDADGSGRNAWYAGDAVFNTGATGDGFIDIYSVDGVKAATEYGPTIVGNVRDSATYNAWTEHWAIGNLNGIYGYSSTTYGAAFGKYGGADYITIDTTNGIRFLDSGDTVQAQLSSGAWVLGEVGASKSNIQITSGAINFRTNTTTKLAITTAGAINVTGTLTITTGGALNIGAAQDVTLLSGADLIMQSATGGSTSNLQFAGNTRTIYMGSDYDNERFCLWPDTANTGNFMAGIKPDGTITRIGTVLHRAYSEIELNVNDGTDEGLLEITNSELRLTYEDAVGGTSMFRLINGQFRITSDAGIIQPAVSNNIDLGDSTHLFKTIWLGGYVKLGITDTDGTVEGELWYDASEDKLKFKTAAGVETVTST